MCCNIYQVHLSPPVATVTIMKPQACNSHVATLSYNNDQTSLPPPQAVATYTTKPAFPPQAAAKVMLQLATCHLLYYFGQFSRGHVTHYTPAETCLPPPQAVATCHLPFTILFQSIWQGPCYALHMS